ncbi:Uncharacterised protein [Serratia rubidaea]|nr:hypothetical protein [Serratia rubidaea]QPR63489.1 hypothetical protein I6G83_22370 [Serratia rubidaea]CAI0721787.1 Uncharacterised protein [Serratia rubidaea]CAI1529087.1 Uncharacterised protein [Serratia rubidaea]HAY0635498.1 hypothetical protein [Serratia rubidaea]
MSDAIRNIGTIIAFLGMLLFIFSIIYFAVIKKNYKNTISKYMSHGLFMRQFDILAVSAGYFGSMIVTIFFWQLLTRKRIRLSKTEYLGDESYDFINTLPKSETRWIKRYFYLFLIWSLSILLGGAMMYLPDWLHMS